MSENSIKSEREINKKNVTSGHHVLLAQTAELRRNVSVLALVALGGHVVHER